jgi:CheY-like chemotaxis protein
MTRSSVSARRHVLLIEDSEPDATLTEIVHNDVKYCSTLHTVQDGDAALAYLKNCEEKPDLIFLDLSLPKRSGFEVLVELKQAPGCGLTPIVILTASPNPADVREAYRLGASSVIKKTADLDEFYRILHSCYQYWCSVVVLPSAEPGM